MRPVWTAFGVVLGGLEGSALPLGYKQLVAPNSAQRLLELTQPARPRYL
jgi:hypothetical protein